MGIYDRDYYRRDGPSFLGSFLERGTVCKWLIGINVVVFALQLLTARSLPLTEALDLNVQLLWEGQVWRLLTYAFLHAGFWHILFNMLLLWWFGTDMEELYGPAEFLAFYLVAAVCGGVLFALTSFAGGVCLGASGAVTAVLVLCAIHYPTRVIYVFMILPVPIWLFVVFEVAMDAYTLLSQRITGIAVAAHLGGALFAFAYYKTGLRLTKLWASLRAWRRRQSRPKLRVYREEEPAPAKVAAAVPAASVPDDEHLEAKLDAVLEKISRVGYENLTESERQLLLRASERLKRRRS